MLSGSRWLSHERGAPTYADAPGEQQWCALMRNGHWRRVTGVGWRKPAVRVSVFSRTHCYTIVHLARSQRFPAEHCVVRKGRIPYAPTLEAQNS
jgi:hypothetical protein